MHGGAPLRVVDRFAGKQRRAAALEIASLRKRDQQGDRLARDLVLGEIEQKIVERDGKLLKAQRISREQVGRALHAQRAGMVV